jgi:hypothetical protein
MVQVLHKGLPRKLLEESSILSVTTEGENRHLLASYWLPRHM